MLSKTEGSHIKALCVCFSQCLWENSAVLKNTVLPLSERQSQFWFSSCSWFTDRRQSYHSDFSLSLFSCLSLSVSYLSLYIYVPLHVCILMACVYTCITPCVRSCPRTTLFNCKPFISLKNFNMLLVSFLCISLTTGNLVINLNGQNIVIFRKQGGRFCIYSYFTLFV